MSFIALYEQHLVERGVLLERLKARHKAWIAKVSSEVVVDQETPVYRSVEGFLASLPDRDDKDREQVGGSVGLNSAPN